MIAWPAGMRVVSAVFQALAGFLLWLFLRRIGTNAGIALLVAVVWTGHPMACESVCWISERKNVLAALFGFAALLAWTTNDRWLHWPLTTILYTLAVLSKPTAVGFFPILVVLEILNLRREAQKTIAPISKTTLAARLFGIVGLAAPLAVTIAIVWANVHVHNIYFVEHPGGSLFTALLTDIEIFARYIFNIVVPVNLSFFYGVIPIVSLADPRVWLYGTP